MPKYNRYEIISLGLLDPNDPKYDRTKAEILARALGHVHQYAPEYVGIVEAKPFGKFEYMLSVAGDTRTKKFSCGHEYHLAMDVYVRPFCETCYKEMEREVKINPALWSKRPVVVKTPGILDKLKVEVK